MVGNQTISSMFDFSSFILMVRIRTFLGSLDWRPWADSGIVIFLYYSSCARPCHTSYEILLRHRSTLYSCGYDRLLSMDPPYLFVAMTPLDFIWRLFAYCVTMIVTLVTHVGSTYIFMVISCRWTCMSQRSVLSNIYLSFRYLHSSLSILDSLLSPYSVVSFIMYFGYHLSL